MKKSNAIYPALILLAVITSSCSSSDSSTPPVETAITYSTTSAKGDYSEWILTGSSLEAIWKVVRDDGLIDFTHEFAATCGTPDSKGIRSCTVTSSSCTDGISVCPSALSGSLDMMDVDGVALFVQIGSGVSAELHIGFAKDSGACTQDVSGDYSFIRTGLGLNESFGMYRSDSNFISIMHSDFGFDTPDANTTTQTIEYRTGTESDVLSDGGCVEGVRTRGITGGITIRSMMTASGLFVLDLPAGEGGMISFKTANAATLADFANKTLSGISFPDNSAPEFITAVFGAVSGNKVSLTATTASGTENLDIMSLSTAATSAAPAYPDFTTSPAGYAASVLSATYSDPSAIPGLFKLDKLGDSGRVVMAVMKFGGKVIGVGMVYNYRRMIDINPATGVNFSADGLYNTGNFIIFER